MTEDCENRLAQARSALHSLRTGRQRVSVWEGDTRVIYQPSQVGELQSYVRQLEAECGGPAVPRRRPIRFAG